jgi:hypothetical protein
MGNGGADADDEWRGCECVIIEHVRVCFGAKILYNLDLGDGFD